MEPDTPPHHRAALVAADWTSGTPRLVIESCGECGHRWYLPRLRCPRCAADVIDRAPSEGRGALLAVTAVHRAAGNSPDGGSTPFGVCLVELDERVRTMGRCAPGAVPGQRVRVRFDVRLDAGFDAGFEATIPHFDAEEDAEECVSDG